MPTLSVGKLLFQFYALRCQFVHFSVCCMHYSVGWHINSVCCMHHFVGWYITLSFEHTTLSRYITLLVVCTTLLVGILLCQLYALLCWFDTLLCQLDTLLCQLDTLLCRLDALLCQLDALLVCCTHYSVGSKHLLSRLYIVSTSLSVANMYPVGCMHFVSCKHLLCELYILLLVGTLLFLLYAPVCWLVHYSVSCRTTFLVGPITLLYALYTACFVSLKYSGFIC